MSKNLGIFAIFMGLHKLVQSCRSLNRTCEAFFLTAQATQEVLSEQNSSDFLGNKIKFLIFSIKGGILGSTIE